MKATNKQIKQAYRRLIILYDPDRNKNSDESSENKVYQFNPEKIQQVEAEFNGKKSQRYRYAVIDPNNSNQDKYLEVGKRTSEDIDAILVKEKHYSKFKGLA